MSKVVTLKFLGLALLSGALAALGGCSTASFTPAGSGPVPAAYDPYAYPYYPYNAGPMPGDYYPYASSWSPAPGPPSRLQAP
jgi:hypothetical protein